MTGDDFKTLIAVFSAVVSVSSFGFSWWTTRVSLTDRYEAQRDELSKLIISNSMMEKYLAFQAMCLYSDLLILVKQREEYDSLASHKAQSTMNALKDNAEKKTSEKALEELEQIESWDFNRHNRRKVREIYRLVQMQTITISQSGAMIERGTYLREQFQAEVNAKGGS